MNSIVNQKPPVKDNVKVSIWLFINRNDDIGDTIKAFSTKEAAKKYFYEYIGSYIYDCIVDEDKTQLQSFILNMNTAKPVDFPYLYNAKTQEEFYIEEVVVDE